MRIVITLAGCAGVFTGWSCAANEIELPIQTNVDAGTIFPDAYAANDGRFVTDTSPSSDGESPPDAKIPPSDSASDAPPQEASSTPTCPTGVECEDFETGTLNGAWQLPDTDTPNVNTTTAIESGHAHTGQNAFHIKTRTVSTDTTGIWGTITRSSAFPTSSAQAIYIRAYFYLPPLGDKPFVLFHFAKTAEAKVAELMAMKANNPGPGGPDLLMTESTNVGGTSLHFDTATLPPNNWACIEWMLAPNSGPSAANGKTKAWVNNQLVFDYADIGTTTYPRVWAGFIITHLPPNGIGSMDAWVDDIAMSDHRIGCE